MSNNILFHIFYAIKSWDFVHAGAASVSMKNILKEIGFHPDAVRRLAVASYEAELNTVIHGQGGMMDFTVTPDCVIIIVEDQGPGIPDIKQAMQEGYSTATDEMREMGFGAGLGLPNIKKNADHFDIKSELNKGTRLEIQIMNRERNKP